MFKWRNCGITGDTESPDDSDYELPTYNITELKATLQLCHFDNLQEEVQGLYRFNGVIISI